jgi:putative endonuclease
MKCVFLYIVECSDGSYYTGITNNPERRMNEHNAGFDKESYTYSRRPVILKYCTEFYDPNLAIYWEKRIKGWSHKKKKALIDDDWDALIEFSKRYKIKSYMTKELFGKLFVIKKINLQAVRQSRCPEKYFLCSIFGNVSKTTAQNLSLAHNSCCFRLTSTHSSKITANQMKTKNCGSV